MGRHHFDKHDRDKWGGPDLISAQNDAQPAGQSNTSTDMPPPGLPGGGEQGGARESAAG
jgi:hypothetical protein